MAEHRPAPSESLYNLTLNEAVDLARNRPLRRLIIIIIIKLYYVGIDFSDT